MVQCNLCGKEADESMMYTCFSSGTKTYECINEGPCSEMRDAYAKKKQEEKIQKIKEEYKIYQSDDIIKDLPKEEQFDLKYKYKFEDLVEVPMKFRDGSTHYRHTGIGKIFSWSFINKRWYIPDENMQNRLISNTHASIDKYFGYTKPHVVTKQTNIVQNSESDTDDDSRILLDEEFNLQNLIRLPTAKNTDVEHYIDVETDDIISKNCDKNEWYRSSRSKKIRDICSEFILELKRNSRSIREESSLDEETTDEESSSEEETTVEDYSSFSELGNSRLMELLNTPL